MLYIIIESFDLCLPPFLSSLQCLSRCFLILRSALCGSILTQISITHYFVTLGTETQLCSYNLRHFTAAEKKMNENQENKKKKKKDVALV